MNEFYELYFATGNDYKFQEAADILDDFNLTQADAEPIEVMDEDLEVIAQASVESISDDFAGPVFVEDSGLFIESLDAFPGPISSYVHETLGNDRILTLMEGEPNREAYFESVVALQLPEGRTVTISGRVEGEITEEERGDLGFDYDSIFAPQGERTLGEMDMEEKNHYSHRGEALTKMRRFLKGGDQS